MNVIGKRVKDKEKTFWSPNILASAFMAFSWVFYHFGFLFLVEFCGMENRMTNKKFYSNLGFGSDIRISNSKVRVSGVDTDTDWKFLDLQNANQIRKTARILKMKSHEKFEPNNA